MGKHKHSLKSKKYKGGADGDPSATDTTAAKQETPAAKKNSRFSKMKTGFKTGVNKLKTGVKNLFTRKGKKTASSNSKPPKSDKNAKQNVNDKSTKKQKKNKVSPDPKSQKSAAAASSTEPVSGTTAPTSTTTSTITEPIPVSTPGGQGTLMDVFTTVYSVLAAIGLVVLVTLFVLNTLDIIRFSTSWAAQTFASYFLSKDIFNKDTIEMQLLEYHKYDSKEEPYTIFLQQYIAQFMFLFGAFTAVLIVINLCVYGLLMLYFKLRKYKDHGESLNLVGSFKNFVIIGLTVLSAGMIYVTYKYWFQKSLQKKLINSNKTVQDITQKIYTHMTTNTEFIANLINSTEKQDAIQSNINIMNKVTGTDKIEIIARMIFTSSVYNYFKNIIPGKDEENYNNVIKPMFLQKEGSLLFPTNYMYYQQNMFIPNDYNNIINHIFGEDKVIKNKAEDVALVSELNKIFTLVNSTEKLYAIHS